MKMQHFLRLSREKMISWMREMRRVFPPSGHVIESARLVEGKEKSIDLQARRSRKKIIETIRLCLVVCHFLALPSPPPPPIDESEATGMSGICFSCWIYLDVVSRYICRRIRVTSFDLSKRESEREREKAISMSRSS